MIHPVLLVLLLVAASGCRNEATPVAPLPAPATPVAAPAAPSTSAPAPAPAPASAPAFASAAPKRPWPPPAPDASSDFCIEGVSALDSETCYVLPASPTRELLIYFHGIVPPEKTSRQKTNFETVVKTCAERAGVAALLPRGEQGLAPKGHAGWWGWPTSAAAHAEWTPRLLEKIAGKRRKLEELVSAPFERLYVAGSSSGAYFTIALALNGELRADGFGAISGAASRGRALTAAGRTPFYIGYGTRDTVGSAAQALGAQLKRAGWPVQIAAHPLPHGAAEIYLDEAFAFWRGAAR